MDFMNYISDNALVLIPCIYIIGLILKQSLTISDKYIPLILLVFGEAGALMLMGLNSNAVIQGILITGATVYANQVVKQVGKSE